MKKLGMIALCLAAALGTTTAFATYSGTPVSLTSVEVDGATQTYLLFATTPTGKPACGTNPYGLISVASTDLQKSLTTLMTSAFLAGRTVRVDWTGACGTGALSTYALIDMAAIY